ncbi:MAG: helix-turn-helix domain-containing protein [Acidimicrobiales bacterium]|nr:helix-turn-helix domain-containing protein [Acidimicrobiales bacterium]
MTAAPKTDLSLHEVADRLGVHYMTAYKYVRVGDLPARQDGRRWMVDELDLEAFQNQDGSTPPGPATVTVEDLRVRMEVGDEEGAWDLLVSAGAHISPLAAQQDLIAPALRETGQRWADGRGTIAQEHIATVVATRLISRLGNPTRRGRRVGTVLIACPPGDTHTLATAFFANLVRGEGVNAVDLGRAASPETILDAADRADGNVAVAIAVSASGLEASTHALVQELRSHPNITSVVVGGVAVPDEATALAMGSDCFCDSPETAAAAVAHAARV